MNPTPRERALAGLIALLAVAAVALPFIPQDEGLHLFADTRSWLGVPNAWNVLSNLPFAIAGAAGLVLLKRRRLHLPNGAFAAGAALFFAGLIATALCSAWYHAAPDSANLVYDRMGMVLAFAGTFGMLAADKVSARAGWMLGALALAAGPVSVAWWLASGSLTPYAVVQFGGMLLLLTAAVFWREGAGPAWGWMLALYALAKVGEVYDPEIYRWTAHCISGHAVKHLLAAGTALAVIGPILDVAGAGRGSRRRWRAVI